ncbi:MAG: PepSY domain-containing protein [Coprobacillus sp.]
MLKGLKIIFVSCMAIGATAFAYQMINVQDVQADGQKVQTASQKDQTDVQASATQEVEKQETTLPKPVITSTTSSKEITADKAKEIALSQVGGKFIRSVKDDDEYHVYIEKDGYKYDVEVDLYKGTVDDVEKEKTKTTQAITEDKAKQLALGQVNGKIVDIKADDDDYNVYIEKDNYIYEIEIDRYRGTVDEIDKEKKPTTTATVISKEKAKQIALSKVNGTVREIDYDDDDCQYDITIDKDMIEYEIKIDAKSGGVLEIKKDD